MVELCGMETEHAHIAKMRDRTAAHLNTECVRRVVDQLQIVTSGNVCQGVQIGRITKDMDCEDRGGPWSNGGLNLLGV